MDFEVRHIDGTTVNLISNANKCAITSATQTRKLCGNDTVTINLQSATYLEFQVGDTIVIFGQTYTLNQLPTVKKESERSYSYTLVFEGLQYTLIDRVFLMPDNTQGDNLMFDLAGMLDVLDDNINRGNTGKPYVFDLATDLQTTEYKNLSLTGKNCLAVLQQLCQEWDTEFVFKEEANQITIKVGKAGTAHTEIYTYGRGGGVYELNREKGATDICTRLFVYGGTQNLTYYRHNRLCLPSKTKNQSYVEDATAQGVYGIKEQVKNFDDIYPNRIGTVSSVSGCEYYEFIDSSMANQQYGFDLNEKWPNTAAGCTEWLALRGLENTEANRTIYYNDVANSATRYLIDQTTAKIHFNTGALAGYELDLFAYDHATQKFTVKPLVDENGYEFPEKLGDTFKIAVGDEYVILDINLPVAYKNQAEGKLQTEASTYFATVCRPQPKYNLTIQPLALQRIKGSGSGTTEIFNVGDTVKISDTASGISQATIRIDQFTRNLLDVYDYKLTLTDEITYTQQVRTLIEVDQIKRVIEESKIYDVNKIRRGWRDVEEMYNMVFDTEGQIYGEKIQPLSIDTKMLKVGARSQQLVLQNVTFIANYQNNATSFRVESNGGVLNHYTIDEPNIATWNISSDTFTNLATTGLYVYAKCSRTTNSGSIYISAQQIVFDSDANYWHFLVGTLSSVETITYTSGATATVRTFAATYGFSAINGRTIRTGKLQSADGGTSFDLDTGEIKGNITFSAASGSDNYNTINGLVNTNSTVTTAATTANTANATANRAEGKIDNLEIGGRNVLKNSSNIGSGWGKESATVTDGVATLAKTTAETRIYQQPSNGYWQWQPNTTYAVSVEAKATTEGVRLQFQCYGGGTVTYISGVTATLTTEWQRYVCLFQTSDSLTDGSMTFRVVDTNATIMLRLPKLEKGNKATEWSPSPEDVDTGISSAQSAAAAAQQSATSANNAISTMNSDSYFSIGEKKAFRPEWKAISGYDNTTTTPTTSSNNGGSYIEAVKAASGTTVSTTALGTAFDNLKTFLNTYKLYTAEDTNWGNDGQSTLGTRTKAYYDAVDALYDAVAEYWANYAVANLEIGGRNLLQNSSFSTNLDNWNGTDGFSINSSLKSAQVTGALNSAKQINQSIQQHLNPNGTTTFTFSGEIAITSYATKGTTNCFVNPYFEGSRNGSWYGGTFKSFTLDGRSYSNSTTYSNAVFDIKGQGFKKFIYTFEVASDATSCYIYMYARDFTGMFFFRNLKLEKGNKATDWSPSPEDVDAGISKAQAAAAEARQAADTANTTIGNMDSDSYFSTVEKKSFRPDWKAICGVDNTTTTPTASTSYGGSYEQALKAASGTTVSTSALTTAFGNLRTHLNTYALYTNTNTNWGANGQTTLATYTKAYYNAEQAFYDALSDYWSEQQAKLAVNNMTIGAKNIASRANVGYITNTYTESNHVYTQSAGNGAGLKFASTLFTAGEKYVLTFKIKKVSGTLTAIGGHSNGFTSNAFYVDGVKSSNTYTQGQTMTDDTNTHKIEVYLTFNGNVSDNNLYIQPNRGGYNTNNNVFQMWDIMLVQGTKATDWSPAPEDNEAATAEAKQAADAANYRLQSIDSNGCFSSSEKQSLRGEWETIAGTVATNVSASTIISNEATYLNKSSFLNTYLSVGVSTLRTALSEAFENLRTYLNNYSLGTNDDTTTYSGTAFSKTTLLNRLAAYYEQELKLTSYAQNVSNLKATCDTATATLTKDIICPELKAEMLTDPNMRMSIKFTNKSGDGAALNTKLIFHFKTASGGSNITPTGASSADVYVWYRDAEAKVTQGSSYKTIPYWNDGQEVEFVYKNTASGYARLMFPNEEDFDTMSALDNAFKGKTQIMGGLLLADTIIAGSGASQAGINGLESNIVALWAGGSIGQALNFNTPVVIMRDGNAKFGYLRFGNGGSISMPVNGVSRLNITGDALPSTAINQWSGDVYSHSNITLPTGSTSVKELIDLGTNGTGHEGTEMTCTGYGYIGIKASANVNIGELKIFFLAGDNEVELGKIPAGTQVTTSVKYFSISGMSETIAYAHQTGYISINLRFEYQTTSELTLSFYNSSYAQSGNYGFRTTWNDDITEPKTNIANNGFLVLLKSNHLFQVKSSGGTLRTTIKGEVDMAGLLWAGYVKNNGTSTAATPTPYYKNAAKYASSALAVSAYDNTYKRYTVTHRLNSTQIAPQVTAIGGSKQCGVEIYDESKFYVYIPSASDFMLTIYGSN